MRLILLMLDFALRDMRKSKTMFFLIVVSIASSATAILATDSILLGFGNMLEAGNRGWMGDIVITSHDDKKQSIDYIKDLKNEIQKTPHVLGVSVRSYGTAALKVSEKWVQPYRVMGIDVEEEAKVTQFSSQMIEGKFLEPHGVSDRAVVGLTLADYLIGSPYDGERAHAGDEITVLTSGGVAKKYTISGVIDVKTFLPNVMLFLDKGEVENVLMGQKDSEIVVLLNNVAAAADVRSRLTQYHPDLTVHTSEEEAGFVKDILQTIGFISGSINKLLVFVVFLIVNIVIYISVSQRRRQIGIMKSMGASNFFVVGAYLTEAILFGVIGFTLCVFLYAGLYAFSAMHPYSLLIGDFRMVIDSSQMISAFTVVIVAVFLGGILPSWMAARTNIIDVLRNSI